jgi:hypothetical protein
MKELAPNLEQNKVHPVHTKLDRLHEIGLSKEYTELFSIYPPQMGY